MNKIAFLVYGKFLSHELLKENISLLINNFSEVNNSNIEYDIIFGDSDEAHDEEQIDENLQKFSVLNSAKSLSSAVRNYKQFSENKNYKFVIIINSNIFDHSTFLKSEFIFDLSLPRDYLYLSYVKQIDYGYPIDWIWGAPELIVKFENFDDFVKNCFNGDNNYLNSLTSTGWPLTVYTPFLNNFILKILYHLFQISSYPLFKDDLSVFKKFIHRKLNGLKNKIDRKLIRDERIAELHCNQSNVTFHQVYPINSAWSLLPLAKFFIFKENLRQYVRFLDSKDFKSFNISSKSNIN